MASASFWKWLAAACVAALAALAFSPAFRRSSASNPLPAPAPTATAAPVAAAAPVAVSGPAQLTTEQIAERALPSVVAIRCGEQSGAGFFVAEDLVVTNAHVTCAGKQMVSVLLHDGRELLGKVKTRDPWIDFATVEVAGSSVPALRLGDPLSLKPGARLAVLGSPQGLDFSVNEGNASYVGRNLHGIGYLQFSAPVNPGNSGGPLLDATGAAVGIVTLKRRDAEGIAFALPLWYARPPEAPEAKERWAGFLAAIHEADAQERKKMLSKLERPALLGLRPVGAGEVGALLAQMRAEAPRPGRIELNIDQGSGGCLARGLVSRWLPLDEIVKTAGPAPREAEWLLRSGDAKNLYYTVATIDFTGCRLGEARAKISLDGGEPLELSGLELKAAAEASRGGQERQQAHVALSDAADAVHAEQWRAAFRSAHARVDAAGAVLANVRSHASELAGGASGPEAQQRTAAAESLVKSAEADLAELERRASNAAVPREWRR